MVVKCEVNRFKKSVSEDYIWTKIERWVSKSTFSSKKKTRNPKSAKICHWKNMLISNCFFSSKCFFWAQIHCIFDRKIRFFEAQFVQYCRLKNSSIFGSFLKLKEHLQIFSHFFYFAVFYFCENVENFEFFTPTFRFWFIFTRRCVQLLEFNLAIRAYQEDYPSPSWPNQWLNRG